jgi:hypothetical protein
MALHGFAWLCVALLGFAWLCLPLLSTTKPVINKKSFFFLALFGSFGSDFLKLMPDQGRALKGLSRAVV